MKPISKLFYTYPLFLLTYAGFILLPAPNKAVLMQYHLSAADLRLIDLTIILLLAAIWLAGFYGYEKLYEYTLLIRKDKDGREVAKLTRGIFFLVLWLPVSNTLSAILNYYAARHIGALPAVTVINHYVSLAIPLLGFMFVAAGAQGLSNMIKQGPNYIVFHTVVILIIYIGLVYYHLAITTDQRDMVYHLSKWWILLTLVAPYLYMWFMGLVATYQIYRYRQKVAGIVYRKGWSYLALGVGWLIILSIAFQYLNALTAHLQHWSIYALLALVYAILLVLAAGFVIIAIGARKLQRIEEV